MDDIKEAWGKLHFMDRMLLANALEVFPEPLIADVYYHNVDLWIASEAGYLSSQGDCYWITPKGRAMVEQSELWPVPDVFSLLD